MWVVRPYKSWTWSLARAVVHLLLLILHHAHAHKTFRKGAWRQVEAVSGREAVLPCEVGNFEASDMVYVVLWYKNDGNEPIYSYDNRPGRLQASEDRHVIKEMDLQGRVSFRPGMVPALHIRPVTISDQANYTCRVDFRIASSRSTYLRLRVVVPPGPPLLRAGGRPVIDGTLGPLQEGQALQLTCTVAGGDPLPQLSWYKDDQVVDSHAESHSGGTSVNQLSVLRLTRDFHTARLTCRASNNNVTTPSEAGLTVNMNLRPLVTRLVSPPKGLRVGKAYEIICVSMGSRPPANITWTIGSHAAPTTLHSQVEHSVNVSTSRVTIVASRRHHGQRLTCTATNVLFQGHPLKDSILLNVTYTPVCTLELGTGVSSVVKEGEDVYFDCNVDANPPYYKISWYHKGSLLVHAPHHGVVISGNSLALRGVTRVLAGSYVCSASNVEGDSKSKPLNLTVNYAPVCRYSNTDADSPAKVYATAIGQPINVSCAVHASPSDLKYSWVFNNSVTSERLPGDQIFLTEGGRSMVRFLARSHQDYGTLQCWAHNSVGRMTKPCYFHVVPAGRPERPLSCDVLNKTYDSLVVSCTSGFDGGLNQTFFAQVFEAVTGRSQLNMSSRWANFTLSGLTPGLDYIIQVTAKNSLGYSEPVRLEAITYKMAENRMREESGTAEEPSSSGKASTGWVMTLTLAALLLVALVLVLGARCVCSWRQQATSGRHSNKGYTTPTDKSQETLHCHPSDEEELHFEIPTISLDTHQGPITHVEDQAL
ncbi:unnamed protein product [Meganyctiphanes norvegica]|uniref:Nephrin/kirre n=1 Tax=Meganyctiphanes norvegica TaxID=48144 RepID=A0AAV2PV21_MEGNR